MTELTADMKKEIVERSACLIAKASAPKALLSIYDLAALTGFAARGRAIFDLINDRDFPKPVMVGTREKRWFSGEVFRFLEARR